jgi:hypothetical protein
MADELYTTTIPLPLDAQLAFYSSDGTAGITLKFRSDKEATAVIVQLKEAIANVNHT